MRHFENKSRSDSVARQVTFQKLVENAKIEKFIQDFLSNFGYKIHIFWNAIFMIFLADFII